MKSWVDKIYQGHALDILKKIPDESVDCIITSPPYWAVRNYETEYQIWGGIADCSHKWRKADKGVECFCSKCGAWKGELGSEPEPELYIDHLLLIFGEVKRVKIGIISLPVKKTGKVRKTLWHGLTYYFEQQFEELTYPDRLRRRCFDPSKNQKYANIKDSPLAYSEKTEGRLRARILARGARNKRTVWRIPTKGYSGAHFAVFPQQLVKQIISAGCPENFCSICGLPIIKRFHLVSYEDKYKPKIIKCKCNCGRDFSKGVVLDPFVGSGTVAEVALRMGRSYIGIELNPEYVKLAERRIGQVRRQYSLLA